MVQDIETSLFQSGVLKLKLLFLCFFVCVIVRLPLLFESMITSLFINPCSTARCVFEPNYFFFWLGMIVEVDIIAFVTITSILTTPAYINIAKNENPISMGKFTTVRTTAEITKQTGTPKIYQYNNALVFFSIFSHIFHISNFFKNITLRPLISLQILHP